MDERKDELTELYDRTFKNKSDWDKRYLHHKTLRNFIHHYDRIRKENDKAWIYNGLKQYLAFCAGTFQDIERNESNAVYEEYLDKLANYYEGELGFKMVVSHTLYFLLYLLVFVGFALFLNFYISLAIIPLIIYHWYRVRSRQKRGEAYGVYY